MRAVSRNRLRFIVTGFAALFALGLSMHAARGRYKRFPPRAAEDVYVNLPLDYLKIASLSYDEMVSDVQWVRFLQNIPNSPAHPSLGQWMANVVLSIVRLDPRFDPVYERGGTILGVMALRPEEALEVVNQGMERNAGDWRLALLGAYLCFYEMQDFERGAQYMRVVTSIEGHPEWTRPLAARLAAAAGDTDAAIEMLARWAQAAEDPAVKRQFQYKIQQVLMTQDVDNLQALVDQLTEAGAPPTTLSDLVEAGLIESIPREPFGGKYVLESGRVKNTSGTELFRVYFAPDAGPHL